jgi:hypothetical protein
VALRLRLSTDLPCAKGTSRKTPVIHIEEKNAKKIHQNVVLRVPFTYGKMDIGGIKRDTEL